MFVSGDRSWIPQEYFREIENENDFGRAIASREYHKVVAMLEGGLISPNVAPEFGPVNMYASCLEFACYMKDIKMACLLFVHGADPNGNNTYDGVVQSMASIYGNVEPEVIPAFQKLDGQTVGTIDGFPGLYAIVVEPDENPNTQHTVVMLSVLWIMEHAKFDFQKVAAIQEDMDDHVSLALQNMDTVNTRPPWLGGSVTMVAFKQGLIESLMCINRVIDQVAPAGQTMPRMLFNTIVLHLVGAEMMATLRRVAEEPSLLM